VQPRPQRAEKARTFVAARGRRVVAFFSLAAASVEPQEATERLAKGQGAQAIPVILLARLAVDSSEHGRGLGRAMLVEGGGALCSSRRHHRRPSGTRSRQGSQCTTLLREARLRTIAEQPAPPDRSHEGCPQEFGHRKRRLSANGTGGRVAGPGRPLLGRGRQALNVADPARAMDAPSADTIGQAQASV
jgi:hypothetical protein